VTNSSTFTPLSAPPDEAWSFAFQDYAVEHQGQSVIDLIVSYDYVEGVGVDDPFEYPEFLQIYNYIDTFLAAYPNETDFWEILNKNLVTELLSQPIPTVFGFDYQLSEVLDSLTVAIEVQPGSSDIEVPRSSIVTGTPGPLVRLNEDWSFAFQDYAVEHQGQSVIDLIVSYDYVEGIGVDDPFEYPEFLQIYNYIDTFLAAYPNETDFWEILNKNLVTELLSQPIPTVFGFDYQLSEVLDSLTVAIEVQPGSSDIEVPRSSIVTGTPARAGEIPAPIDSVLLDLRGVTGLVTTEFTVNREAAFDNLVGFYPLADAAGGLDLDGDGQADLRPGDSNYAGAALSVALPDPLLTTPNLTESTYRMNLAGGSLLAPYLIPNGDGGNIDFTKDQPIYFAFAAANPDGVDHIRFASGALEFEDQFNGGDQDFNDMVVGVEFLAVV
jgi:hypothetical protein